jgi:hypothetical protein
MGAIATGVTALIAVSGPALAVQGDPDDVHPDHHAEPAQPHAPLVPPDRPDVARLEADRTMTGTAWQPMTTPSPGAHLQAGEWGLMLHALLFVGYDYQGSERGAQALVALGWLMGMAHRPLGPGAFTLRTMLSPEPFTTRDGGYPLLLQTGETFMDEPLRDRQHPHDLFMEIGGLYTLPITRELAFQAYAAAAGEPALGPIGFPHRASGAFDPLAPLGHHWQDSTHIAFGVLTGGLVTRFVKLEGSWFNGREPDETRWNLDLRVPDSFAVRLSTMPRPHLSTQVSYAFLESPEALRPQVSVHRITASLAHARRFQSRGYWATTLVFGQNREEGEPATSSLLLESTLVPRGPDALFGRLEYVQKTGHDLVLTPDLDERVFDVGSLALGYVRSFGPFGSWSPGLGFRVALNLVSRELGTFYGTRVPTGGMVFVRLSNALEPAGVPHEDHR